MTKIFDMVYPLLKLIKKAKLVPSSINQFPTFNYSQPEEYHFSHDSVFLAREIYERNESFLNTDAVQILDLCAGCGIVGLDLIYHQLKERKKFQGEIDFLEVQEVYRQHFEKNVQVLQSIFPEEKIKTSWLQQNYSQPVSKKYDLIISNPPYFLPHQGKLSANEFKNRCRFFLDSDLKTFLQFIRASLKPNGHAYFLIREELKNSLNSDIAFPFQVRGTWVAMIN